MYEQIFEEFNKNGIKYMVVGGVAVNLCGVPRATMDLDLCVMCDSENLTKATSVLNSMDFEIVNNIDPNEVVKEDVREKIYKEKGIIAITFLNKSESDAGEVVDLIYRVSDFNKFYLRKYVIKIREDICVPLISIDDLIEMKTITNRVIDQIDIEGLKKIKEGL